MPIITGPKAGTPEGIRENIDRLIAEGKDSREAVAIAHHVAEVIKEETRNDR